MFVYFQGMRDSQFVIFVLYGTVENLIIKKSKSICNLSKNIGTDFLAI